MKKYFNTKEKAEKHLEYRKECAYKRIEQRGEKILRDGSRVYCDAQDNKWKVFMDIWTEESIKMAEKIHGMDYDNDSVLIPFTSEEKQLKNKIRKEILRHIFLKNYKTNEILSDTINKQL